MLRFITHTIGTQFRNGPASLPLSSSLLTESGVADSRTFLGGGALWWAERLSPCPTGNGGHAMQLAGGSKAACILPVWKKKENSAVPTYLQGDFQCPCSTCFPKVFSVPLPRICVPLGSEFRGIVSALERGCSRCSWSPWLMCWWRWRRQLLPGGESGTHIKI